MHLNMQNPNDSVVGGQCISGIISYTDSRLASTSSPGGREKAEYLFDHSERVWKAVYESRLLSES